MLNERPPQHLLAALFLSVPLLLAGCDKDPGPTGPGSAAPSLQYVGYSDTINRTPTCVKCHAANAAGWKQTRHASALTTLQQSSSYQDYCRQCHTTGWDPDDGLIGADNAFAAASADTSRYRDVQCEVCHGPASQHNSVAPNASDLRKPDDPDLWAADLCGRCHQGAHAPYLDEWSLSRHALADLAVGGFVATNPDCAHCHVAQSAEYWIRTGDSDHVVPAADVQPITCQTCHTAHSKDNPGQLRLPLGDNVICGKCHNAEGALPGEAVHHATWEVFTGTLGFTYPGETYTNSTHTTALLTEKCIGCHVYQTPYVSELEPKRTGHTFYPRIEACQRCHLGATDFDIYGVQTATEALIDQLQAEIDASGAGDMATTAYEEAKYVLDVAVSEGSRGVHNTKYIQKLLQDAIDRYTPTGG